MKFMKAVEAMKQGKKVRRPTWIKGYYIMKEESSVRGFDEGVNQNTDFEFKDLDAIDWEIVEEKKTLSDKIIQSDNDEFQELRINRGYFKLDDVKEALKEFLEEYTEIELGDLETDETELYKTARKHFGDDLI